MLKNFNFYKTYESEIYIGNCLYITEDNSKSFGEFTFIHVTGINIDEIVDNDYAFINAEVRAKEYTLFYKNSHVFNKIREILVQNSFKMKEYLTRNETILSTHKVMNILPKNTQVSIHNKKAKTDDDAYSFLATSLGLEFPPFG